MAHRPTDIKVFAEFDNAAALLGDPGLTSRVLGFASSRGVALLLVIFAFALLAVTLASALQYHFKNLEGLIAATHRYRSDQIVEVRSRCLDELAIHPELPELRDLARVMVHPTFELAGKHADFRRYVRGFSLSLASSDLPPTISVRRGVEENDERLGELLRAALPQLDNESFRRRLDAAIRYVSVSVYGHAQQPNAFRGKTGELFYHHLIDTLVGLLSAKESPETRALSREVAIFEGRLAD